MNSMARASLSVVSAAVRGPYCEPRFNYSFLVVWKIDKCTMPGEFHSL